MAKIDFKTLTGEAAIDEAISDVSTRSGSLQLDIHLILVAVSADWAAGNDVRIPLRQVNQLLVELGDGVRKNAIIQWACSKKLLGFVLNEEDKTVVSGKTKGADLDMRVIANTQWWTFREPPIKQPMNFSEELIKFYEKSATRSAKSKKGDVFDPETMAKVAEIVLAIKAANKAVAPAAAAA